jgi:hypothetical protein
LWHRQSWLCGSSSPGDTQAIRANFGSRVFQCPYQGNVSAAHGTIFKRNWFRLFQQPPEKFIKIVQSWDTSFKTVATKDIPCAQPSARHRTVSICTRSTLKKLEFPELKRQVAMQADFWRPQEINFEDRASGQSLIQELKLSTTYPVIPVRVDRDKENCRGEEQTAEESGSCPKSLNFVQKEKTDCFLHKRATLKRPAHGGEQKRWLREISHWLAGILDFNNNGHRPAGPRLALTCLNYTLRCQGVGSRLLTVGGIRRILAQAVLSCTKGQ